MYSFLETANKIKRAKKSQSKKEAENERQTQLVIALATMADEILEDLYFPPDMKEDVDKTVKYLDQFTSVINRTRSVKEAKSNYIWTVFELIQAIYEEETLVGVDRSFKPNEGAIIMGLLLHQIDKKYGSRHKVGEIKQHPLVRVTEYLKSISTSKQRAFEENDRVVNLMNAKLWLIYETLH